MRNFIQTYKGVPKKSSTRMQPSLRNHETLESHQESVPYLCMSVPACFTFSLYSQAFSVSPICLRSYGHSQHSCLLFPVIWISESNSWRRDSEWLCLGQVTTRGPISHKQKGGDNIPNGYLVPATVEWGAFLREGRNGSWPERTTWICFPLLLSINRQWHKRGNIFSSGSRSVLISRTFVIMEMF